MHQAEVFQEKEYFRIGQFSFRNLTPKHQAKAMEILTRQFHRQQPLIAAYSKKHPNNPSSHQMWSYLFSLYMDEAATNNLSVVVLDMESNENVIAAYICRDMCYVPQAFIDNVEDKVESPFTFVFELENQMKKQLTPEITEFFNQKGRIVDFMSVAIDHAYQGRKVIFKNMLSLGERLAKERGYTHGYIFAGNGKTNIVAKNANYQLIARVDASKVVLRNRQPFSQLEQLHKNPSFWLKEL